RCQAGSAVARGRGRQPPGCRDLAQRAAHRTGGGRGAGRGGGAAAGGLPPRRPASLPGAQEFRGDRPGHAPHAQRGADAVAASRRTIAIGAGSNPMSADEATPLDEYCAALLADLDEALAAGDTSRTLEGTVVPDDVRPRLERDLACLALLR